MKSGELYSRCKERDEAAWTYAYNYVLSFLRGIAGSRQDILDIAHDAILYFMAGGLRHVREPEAFKNLLRRKGLGLVIDRYRHERLHRHVPLGTEDEEGWPMRENPEIGREDADWDTGLFLERVMNILKESLRGIGKECSDLMGRYFLARFEGRKVKDLAEDMGRPASTLRVTIHRCYKRLIADPAYRSLLEDYGQRE